MNQEIWIFLLHVITSQLYKANVIFSQICITNLNRDLHDIATQAQVTYRYPLSANARL